MGDLLLVIAVLTKRYLADREHWQSKLAKQALKCNCVPRMRSELKASGAGAAGIPLGVAGMAWRSRMLRRGGGEGSRTGARSRLVELRASDEAGGRRVSP